MNETENQNALNGNWGQYDHLVNFEKKPVFKKHL